MPALPPLTMPNEETPDHHVMEGSVSPTAPPYSPITPVFSSTTLPDNHSGYQVAPPPLPPRLPSPVPISDSDNPDAIALRSAISILQIQRQQSLQDLKILEKQKRTAVADPKNFAKAIAAGKIKSVPTGELVVVRALEDQQADAADDSQIIQIDTDDAKSPAWDASSFGKIPGPQNIVRCPPINWAKYHVVGDSLDKLHDEQVLRPTSGQPRKDSELTRASEHVVASPYRPFVDKVPDPPMRTRSVSKKEL